MRFDGRSDVSEEPVIQIISFTNFNAQLFIH